MATLYDIDYRLKMLEENMVDVETGEIIDNEEDFNALFDEISMDLNQKIEQTVCFIKNLNSDIDAFKAEEEKLAQRRKVKENLANRLKERIDEYITNQCKDENGEIIADKLNAYKMETPKMKITYRKSEKVEVLDQSLLPKKFLKVEKKISPMKTDIKNAIKSGLKVKGAILTTNYNMQIK